VSAFARVQHLWAEQGSTGTRVRWAAQAYGWRVPVVSPTERPLTREAPAVFADLRQEPGCHVIPSRWGVERTFSWLGRQRRLSNEDERLPSRAEAFIALVGIWLLLARRTPASPGAPFKYLMRGCLASE